MSDRKLTRRDFLRLAGVTATGAAIAACAPAAPEVVEVEKPVVVEKEVVKEVPVEKVVEKEVEVVVTATAPAKSAEKPVIRWQYNGAGRYQVAAEESANTFNEMQDDILLLIEPRPPETFEKLMAAMVAGVAPDVFEYWGLWFAKLHQKGQLKDVQPLADSLSQEWIDDFVPNEWDNFGRLSFIPGKRVAMPRYINFMYLEYNKGFFDEAGVDYPDANWTMDDMAEAAEKLTVRQGDETTRFGGAFRSAHVMERQFYNLNRFGGNFVKYEEPKKCLLGTPEAQEALQWLLDRYWVDKTYAPRVLVNSLPIYNALVGGMAAFQEEGGPHYAIRDGLEVYKLDYTHICQGPVRRSSYLVTDGYGLWSGSHFPDAAWEVMHYLSDDVNQDIRQRVTGQTATRMNVVAKWPDEVVEIDPGMAETNLHIPLEAFEMGYGKDDERFFCQAEAEEVINPLLEKLYMIEGGDSPTILADACPAVEAAQTCEAI